MAELHCFSLFNVINIRHFKENEERSAKAQGSFRSSNNDTLLEVALTGLGISQLPTWMLNDHLKSGRLSKY